MKLFMLLPPGGPTGSLLRFLLRLSFLRCNGGVLWLMMCPLRRIAATHVLHILSNLLLLLPRRICMLLLILSILLPLPPTAVV